MGFLDFFRPRLTHKDWNVREKAVSKVNDQDVLTNLVLNDPSEQVKLAALSRIDDQARLAKIVLNGPSEEVNLRALEKIEDFNQVRDCFEDKQRDGTLQDLPENVRVRAAKELIGTFFQRKLAEADPSLEVRKAALTHIARFDAEWLIGFAKRDLDRDTKDFAEIVLQEACAAEACSSLGDSEKFVVQLKDEDLLARVAKTSHNCMARLDAIAKIRDQRILADIVASMGGWEVQEGLLEKALANFHDQELLAGILRGMENSKVGIGELDKGREIVRKIQDQSLLADLAVRKLPFDFRLEAVWRLTDQSLLETLQRLAPDPNIRSSAAEQLRQLKK